MKRILTIFLALAAILVPGTASSQVIEMKGSFLRQLQKRDSVLIGDQLEYGMRLDNIAEGTMFRLPDFTQGFMDSVEVVNPVWEVDTVKTTKEGSRKLYDAEFKIRITSFEEGDYTLRPLSLLRSLPGSGQEDTLLFEPQTLSVKTMPVDTTSYVPHDIKGQIRYPLTFRDFLPYILIALLVLLMAGLIVYFIKHRKKKVEAEAAEPAHIVALRKLDHWRGNKYWAPEKQKQFYSGVTDTLREYMAARYGIDAMESTTAEIFADLKDKEIPRDLYDETKALFETSDFVKFAKMTVTDDENAKVVPTAVRFVTTTYQEEVNAEAGTAAGTDAAGTEAPQTEKPQEEDNSRFMPGNKG